jgi:copper chaperone NosL
MTHFPFKLRRVAGALSLLALLAACSDAARTVAARDPADDAACALDGMVLKDFPGPKAQIVYQDGQIAVFCSLTELFEVLYSGESKRAIQALYVQDMGQADWQQPRGHWIDARKALFVVGSRKMGAMGPTFGAFAQQQDAQAFSAREGGRVLQFSEMSPAILPLASHTPHGGAMH